MEGQLGKIEPLLSPRAHTAFLLGCSVSTVIRLEKKGVLRPIRLIPNGAVLHRLDDVEALIRREP